MVEMLQFSLSLLRQRLATIESHHVNLPDQNVWYLLAIALLLDLSLYLLFQPLTASHVNKHKCLDLTVCEDFGSTRAERAIGTGDQDGPAMVRLGVHSRSSMALLVETPPREVLIEQERYTPDREHCDGSDCENDTKSHLETCVLICLLFTAI